MTKNLETATCDKSDNTELSLPEVAARRPLRIHSLSESRRAEFFSKICPEPNSGCFLWTAGATGGYGAFDIDGENFGAHVIAFVLAGGVITEEKPCVLHSCNTRLCTNPAHLRAGTKGDNIEDMVRAGRQAKGDRNGARLHPESRLRGDNHPARTHPERLARGERAGGAKITQEIVTQIRSKWVSRIYSQRKLAREYGLRQSSIWAIIHGETWKHVT